MAEEKIVTAALLVIGDEILSGRTADRNIHYVAEHMTRVGIRLKEVRVVPDEEDAIVAAVNELRARYTYLFTTGGIGPTHDDITADAIAKALGVGIGHDERAVALLQAFFAKRKLEPTPARLRMARIPHGASLIRNAISVAPGFMSGERDRARGRARRHAGDARRHHASARHRRGECRRRPSSCNRAEGDVADLFAAHQKTFPDVTMGSYPSFTDGRISNATRSALDRFRAARAPRRARSS